MAKETIPLLTDIELKTLYFIHTHDGHSASRSYLTRRMSMAGFNGRERDNVLDQLVRIGLIETWLQLKLGMTGRKPRHYRLTRLGHSALVQHMQDDGNKKTPRPARG